MRQLMMFILVVDDEPHIVRTLTINLRARDHDAESAGDGGPADRAASSNPTPATRDTSSPRRESAIASWSRAARTACWSAYRS
jgi:DNA-binding response OmpR family regulator